MRPIIVVAIISSELCRLLETLARAIWLGIAGLAGLAPVTLCFPCSPFASFGIPSSTCVHSVSLCRKRHQSHQRNRKRNEAKTHLRTHLQRPRIIRNEEPQLEHDLDEINCFLGTCFVDALTAPPKPEIEAGTPKKHEASNTRKPEIENDVKNHNCSLAVCESRAQWKRESERN